MKNQSLRYALYVRKSSEDSSKQIQSIDNQIAVLKEKAVKEGLEITKVYQESRSAKKPNNREQFSQMINDLENQKIDAIICWKLDRLSRNPLDGGKVQYLLQSSVIKEIVTYEKTYYPNDNSIMMTFELGMATEYSLALGKNVKRGHSYKIQKGHYPNTAPIGYLNTPEVDKGNRNIILDPERAPIVRKLWDLLLTGDYGVSLLARMANDMGLRTRARRSFPEKKITRHGMYCVFKNPFYYGEFRWGGELHQGNHEPMVTKEEFDKAQIIISKHKSAPRTPKHSYAFKHFIRCGECGASITAEQKNKRRKNGSLNQRSYYRCTHNLKAYDCRQPTIREEDLEKQFSEILASIKISNTFVTWARKWFSEENEEASIKEMSVRKAQTKKLNDIDNQLNKLLDLKLKELIDDETYKSKKNFLTSEKLSIQRNMESDIYSQDYRRNKVIEMFDFCREAQDLFDKGDFKQKQIVLKALGSRFYLKDKKLTVDLADGFKYIKEAKNIGLFVDDRFATLDIQAHPNKKSSEEALIKNGGDEGTRTLDPLRDRQVL